MKHENNIDDELDKIPKEMEGLEDLAVFNKRKFEELKKTKIEIVKYGDIEIDADEEAALKLHPKMALPRKLREGYMNLQQDISYTKVRWQLRQEEEREQADMENYEDHHVRKDKNRDNEIEDDEKKKKEREEIEQARARQVYNCEDKTYDERKQRVTDLKECTRIFLPKPLQVNKEAQLETRRELHQRVSEKYRREQCDDKGAQENNLTREELRGIRKLEKRKNNGELVVIMTDKSSKLCAMKRRRTCRKRQDNRENRVDKDRKDPE